MTSILDRRSMDAHHSERPHAYGRELRDRLEAGDLITYEEAEALDDDAIAADVFRDTTEVPGEGYVLPPAQ